MSTAMLFAVTHSNAQVVWKTSLPAAKQASAISGKPILLMFHATWCGPCKQMEETTFHDAGVIKLLQNTTCVMLDVDKEEATARAFEVNSIPRFLLLPPGGANAPLMDTLGYQDAEQFSAALSSALHLTSPGAAAVPPENPELTEVRRALADHSFDKLQQKSPTVAAAGMKRLVEELGVFQEHDIDATLALLRSAGEGAFPALFSGMNQRYLAVRTGSYRALQTLLRERHISTTLQFDPWASSSARQHQVDLWTKWWNSRSNHR